MRVAVAAASDNPAAFVAAASQRTAASLGIFPSAGRELFHPILQNWIRVCHLGLQEVGLEAASADRCTQYFFISSLLQRQRKSKRELTISVSVVMAAR